MLKTGKDLGVYLAQLCAAAAGIQLFLSVCMVLANGESSYLLSMMVLMPSAVTLLGGFINIYSYRLQLALSMGATRRGFFAGTQISKVALVITLMIIYVLSFEAVHLIMPSFAAFPLEFLFLLFAAFCLMGTFTEFVGVLMIVLGKAAYIIFMVLIMIFCGIMGAMSSMFTRGGMMIDVIAGFFGGLTGWVPFALLGLSVLLAIINYIFVRKVTVKG